MESVLGVNVFGLGETSFLITHSTQSQDYGKKYDVSEFTEHISNIDSSNSVFKFFLVKKLFCVL